MTGALPRVDDHVDVALRTEVIARSCAARSARSRRCARPRTTGAATFSVDFELDEASRRQLTALLTAARAANVTIKPPPPRSTRRFPVEWPVCLGTMRGAMQGRRARRLDRRHVRAARSSRSRSTRSLNFSVVLDDGGASDRRTREGRAPDHRGRGGARAGCRRASASTIVDMAETDRDALARVPRADRAARREARADRRVARAARRAAGGARGCGLRRDRRNGSGQRWCSSRATDARPVDAALIDAGWLQNGASASWVENRCSRRETSRA